jgi:hypothetical protein
MKEFLLLTGGNFFKFLDSSDGELLISNYGDKIVRKKSIT